VHYLYYQALEAARHVRMTEEQREEQLISRVYGNIHLEQPGLTRELVRELVKRDHRERNRDAAVAR
jgi:hypothetical protein